MRRCPVTAFLLLFASTVLFAESTPGEPAAQPSNVYLDVIKRNVFIAEASLVQRMHRYTPVVESYIQGIEKPDASSTPPLADKYFLGRLTLGDRGHDDPHARLGRLRHTTFVERLDAFYRLTYLSPGFLDLVYLGRNFDPQHYELHYARRSFLGSVRAIVFDVVPVAPQAAAFRGRIWVEDKGYNIVRINGTYAPHFRPGLSFHFDSWRICMGPGLWLPALMYAEQSDSRRSLGRYVAMKSQTRFWGYSLKPGADTEPEDSTFAPGVPSPQNQQALAGSEVDHEVDPQANRLNQERQEQEEDAILNRLQSAGLLAPEGEVSAALERVARNLLGARYAMARCRVLLTSPLETFTVGHTIVVSRGLLDVLPDEASVAMVMAPEAGHIALGHPLDPSYAGRDRILDPEPPAARSVGAPDAAQRERLDLAADEKGLELLANSPYRDKLANAGLFLRALAARSQELPALVTSGFRSRWVVSNSVIGIGARVQARLAESRLQDPDAASRIAALPLGSRIKLDPWDDHVELEKAIEAPPPNGRDRLAFEITPVVPSLARVRAVPEIARNAP